VAGRVVERVGKTPRRSGERALTFLDAAERSADHHGQPLGIHAERPLARLDAKVVGRGDEQPRGARVGNAPPVDGAGELLDLAPLAHAQVLDGKALDDGNAVGPREERGPEGVEVLADRRDHAGGADGDALSSRQRARPRRRRS
jgi:hypothetical protein